MVIDSDDANTFHGKYRPDINGLRAIAVVAVVLNHFDRTVLPLGYLGVDIFFVISGFVITSSIYHRPEGSLFEFWLAFFSRRFKRLFPALGACVLITSILVCLVDPYPVESLRTGLSSLFGLSNLHMYRQAIDYFGSRADLNAFTQTWSLGVEEQFYLVFPIAIWATGFLRASVRASKPLITVLSVASLASLAFYVFSAARNQPAAFFLLPSRLWELGVGVVLFCVTGPNALMSRLARLMPSSLALSLLVALLFLKVENDVVATIVLVVLCAILIAGLCPRTTTYEILTRPMMSYLGAISYSLYLWHWTVICLSRWTVGLSWWLAPFQFALMLALAAASYHVLEAPLRRAQWSRSRARSFFYGLMSVSGAALTVLVLQGPAHEFFFLGAKPTEAALAPPSVAASAPAKGTILLVGDSHAGHFISMIRDVSVRFNLRPVVISKGATPFPDIPISSPTGGLTYEKSRLRTVDMERRVDRLLADLNPDETNLIVISSFYRYYFEAGSGKRKSEVKTHYDSMGRPISMQQALDNWLDRLKAFAADNRTLNMIIILSTPEMPDIFDQALCNEEWFRPYRSDKCNVQVDRREMAAALAKLNSRIVETVASSPNVAVFDPLPALCPEGQVVCLSQDVDHRLFADEDHLTVAGARRVAAAFSDFLLNQGLVR
jgi:peptidoglycan/LPS O-acetylase OafA/YrhL